MTRDECSGAPSLVEPECAGYTYADFEPTVEDARGDTSVVYSDDCRSDTATTVVRECVFGPEDGTRVALIGDSHAAVWFPALKPIADKFNWRLQVYYRSACSFNMTPRYFDGGDPDQLDRCLEWNANLQEELAGAEPHELVITASFSGMTYVDAAGSGDNAAGIEGFHAAWQVLRDRGSQLVVMAEPPLLGKERLACQLESPTDPASCSTSPEDTRAQSDLAAQAARAIDVPVIDMTTYFCTDEICPTVIGGVLVYRDEHHFTGTFGATLAPYLEHELIGVGALIQERPSP